MTENIPGVANYCFRWCERCPFTDRCSTFEMGQQFEKEPLQPVPATFPAMSGEFSRFWPRLRGIMNDQGSEWATYSYGIEDQAPAATHGLSRKEARALGKDVVITLLNAEDETHREWLRETVDYETVFGQGITCLRWYGLLIGAKMSRVIGSSDRSPFPDESQDHLPTAKLLHLILARAIAAATLVMEERPESIDLILPLAISYCRLLNYLRTNFSDAHKVQRPGFDNPRYATEYAEFYNNRPPLDPFADNSWSVGGRAPSE